MPVSATDTTPLCVLLIGCGAIGRHIITTTSGMPDIAIRAVLVRPERVSAYKVLLGPDIAVASDMTALSDVELDYAVECAGHDGLRQFGPMVLRHGIDLGVLSAGALGDEETAAIFKSAATAGGARIDILSGALAGVDSLRAMAVGGLTSVHLTSRKPPAAWRGSAADAITDLDNCAHAVTVFSGTARKAALLFPKNANVGAVAALAGLGLDETRVTLIADPDVSENVHELDAHGAFGTMKTVMRGAALPDNPRSSAMAALSGVAALKSRRIAAL